MAKELTKQGLLQGAGDLALLDFILPDAEPHNQRNEHQAGAHNEGRPCTALSSQECLGLKPVSLPQPAY